MIFFTFLLVATAAGSYTQQGQQVGYPCATNTAAQFNFFIVQLWPPVLNEDITTDWQVTFYQNVEMSYYSVGTSYNRQSWTYQNYPYLSSFNNTGFLEVSNQGPIGKIAGNYVQQITIHDTQNQIVSCWQYGYSLV